MSFRVRVIVEVRCVIRKQDIVWIVVITQEVSIVRYVLKDFMEIQNMAVVVLVRVLKQGRILQEDVLSRNSMCNVFVNKATWENCVRNA